MHFNKHLTPKNMLYTKTSQAEILKFCFIENNYSNIIIIYLNTKMFVNL